MINEGWIRKAIKIFSLDVEINPESWNGYHSLVEALMKNGDDRKLIFNYQKSLELNPENSNAREMLKKLEKK